MEYIIGEELNELCRRGIAQGRFLPLEHAVELIRQAAAGLGYFHAKRGAEGSELADEPLEIVHLDISPSNLLVTQDGFLKVIDFGIARARGQQHRGHVLPGKLSYMSPEQAARGEVDHRSDVFSLGIVLYEITVGKRLYPRASSRGRPPADRRQDRAADVRAPQLSARARVDRDARARETSRRPLRDRLRSRRRPRDVPARRAAPLRAGSHRALPRCARACDRGRPPSRADLRSGGETRG